MQVQNNPVRHRPNTGTLRAGRQAHLLTGEFLTPTAATKHQQGRSKRIYPVRKFYKALLNNSGLKEKSQVPRELSRRTCCPAQRPGFNPRKSHQKHNQLECCPPTSTHVLSTPIPSLHMRTVIINKNND